MLYSVWEARVRVLPKSDRNNAKRIYIYGKCGKPNKHNITIFTIVNEIEIINNNL